MGLVTVRHEEHQRRANSEERQTMKLTMKNLVVEDLIGTEKIRRHTARTVRHTEHYGRRAKTKCRGWLEGAGGGRNFTAARPG